ncbi:MAG: Cof-type HAD-IIB family hydrolase [Terracoccus sp.]
MLTDLTALRESRDGHPIRLVVADMDGTLLDADGVVPDRLWPLLDLMHERGIAFCPASGRQYATLLRLFSSHSEGMVFIAENGAFVVRDDVEVSSDPIEAQVVGDLVATTRRLSADGTDLGAVLCGTRTAWVERHDEAFMAQLRPYYASIEEVSDLGAVTDDIVKVAVHALDRSEHVAAGLSAFAGTHQVVVSSPSWVDVMKRGTNKGAALRRLQDSLGVSPDETVVFGDYLNDLEMLDEATLSFAMDNAHADVLERARHRAPSNRDHGVVHVLETLLAPHSPEMARTDPR